MYTDKFWATEGPVVACVFQQSSHRLSCPSTSLQCFPLTQIVFLKIDDVGKNAFRTQPCKFQQFSCM